MGSSSRHEYNAAYYVRRADEMAAGRAAYRASHRAELAAYARAYHASHRLEHKLYAARYRDQLKHDVFAAYGGAKCACCGEDLFEGLMLDHIAGDGAAHRKASGLIGGHALYLRLRREGFPPGYQVLCGTCNFAKGILDYCPHEDRKIAWG
jgi:hypothetical protein